MGKNSDKMLLTESLKKKTFGETINRDDGLSLQMHHTVTTTIGKSMRIRFVYCDYDKITDQMCACDHEGNVFLVNFHYNKYWILPDERAHIAQFVPLRKNLILLGRSSGILHFINCETGRRVGLLDGHKTAIKFMSFSDDCCCLTATERQAIIWDLKSNTQIHHLDLEANPNTFKYISFMPVTNNILACFNDDVMHVWKFKTFDLLKQILPETWKGRHLQTITFTKNGRAMVLGGRSRMLVVLSTDSWTLERLIELPANINGVRQLQFVPELFDGGNNKILAVLTLKNTFHFYDMVQNIFLNRSVEERFCITKFCISPNGKYLALIYTTGELNIYTLSKLLKGDINVPITIIDRALPKPKKAKSRIVRPKCDEVLDIKRLLPILRQYGEYPSEYRCLIWKTILRIPENHSAFNGLVSRGFHSLMTDLHKLYPIVDKLSIVGLKRIMSALSNWCALFSQAKNFALFVYPFVRMFHNDPLANFEVVLTVIINWCQHFFEYFPFPPTNVLCLIENIISERDPQLLKHLLSHGVTSNIYAWTLLETSFSEVLSRNEWMILWDHLLSNHPSFIIHVTATYSIYHRAILLSFTDSDQFEKFYHTPNSIHIQRFLAKCYQISSSVHSKIDPVQYFRGFQELTPNTYPVFENYPKEVVDYQERHLKQLKEEENVLETEEQNVIEKHAQQMMELKKQIRRNENDIRKKNLNRTYKKVIDSEQGRLMKRRSKLTLLKQSVHDRELRLLTEARDNLLEQSVRKRNDALERTIDEISRKQIMDDVHDKIIEDNIRKRNGQLLAQKENLSQILNINYGVDPLPIEHTIIGKQQDNLSKQYDDFLTVSSEDRSLRKVILASRIAALDHSLLEVECSLAREIVERQSDLVSNQSMLKSAKLESVTKKLENDVAMLLQKLAEHRLSETEERVNELEECVADRRNLVNETRAYVKELKDTLVEHPQEQLRSRSGSLVSSNGRCETNPSSPILTIYAKKSNSDSSLKPLKKPRKKSKFAL